MLLCGNNTQDMGIHIGKIIQATIKSQGISVVSFALQINCTRRNLYQIFKKDHIDTALLQIISDRLGVNLFLNYLSVQEIKNYQNVPLTNRLEEMIADLQGEIKKENI